MLKNKPDLLVTDEETQILDEINRDNSTGRHLISERSEAYWKMRGEVSEAAKLEVSGVGMTERQKQILEYLRQGEDYFYWKNLPDEKKLFVEVDE